MHPPSIIRSPTRQSTRNNSIKSTKRSLSACSNPCCVELNTTNGSRSLCVLDNVWNRIRKHCEARSFVKVIPTPSFNSNIAPHFVDLLSFLFMGPLVCKRKSLKFFVATFFLKSRRASPSNKLSQKQIMFSCHFVVAVQVLALLAYNLIRLDLSFTIPSGCGVCLT